MRIVYLISLTAVTLYADCALSVEDANRSEEGKSLLVVRYDRSCALKVQKERERVVLVVTKRNGGDDTRSSGDTQTDRILALAKSKMGDRYESAKAGPDRFDCSGFVYYVFAQNGIDLPRTALAQSKSGEKISRASLQPGDILFFDTAHRGHVNHSGIYLGEGKFIHASSGKAYGVTISDLDHGFYKEKFLWGVRKLAE